MHLRTVCCDTLLKGQCLSRLYCLRIAASGLIGTGAPDMYLSTQSPSSAWKGKQGSMAQLPSRRDPCSVPSARAQDLHVSHDAGLSTTIIQSLSRNGKAKAAAPA